MKRFTLKKKIVAAVAVAGLVGAGGAAFAVWSTTGSGSGSATASSNVTSTVTAVASPSADAALWPGNASPVAVHFTINNPNPYPVKFTTFSDAAVGTVTAGPLTGTVCTFSLSATSGSLDSAVTVPANTSVVSGVAGSATILKMDAASDNSCQGSNVAVTLNVQGSQI